MRSDPVDTVREVGVMGAKVMEGTWSDGHEEVHVWPAHPLTPENASNWEELEARA